jgi:phenylalanyl-tRNA synthetase beta chain
MPKIEVNENLFFSLVGKRYDNREEFEEILSCAKAELDEDSDKSLSPEERTLKIELNDTNRPDLWATAGCARALRVYASGKRPAYPFFGAEATRKVFVSRSVRAVRPIMVGFCATGKEVTDAGLRDMIQTQEKLAWNYGRKRRTISMGIYRTSRIKWPVHYVGVDPESVAFVPLQWDRPMNLRQILAEHPKGREYAFIQEHEPIHPLLIDDTGAVLSYPPIINSADIGAVQVGDSDLFIELTGTDPQTVTLSASIVACDLYDQGYTIEPVEIIYDYEITMGVDENSPKLSKVVTPYYFQEPIFCSLARVEKFTGEKLSGAECVAALAKMGVKSEARKGHERGQDAEEDGVLAWPPEYRNDYLHAADVMEDVVIGRGMASFPPERPHAFTIGRPKPLTLFTRRVREAMIGMGYQEMIYNYLGSRKNLVEKMCGTGERIIQIANPMTENFEYVRDSVLASLMESEAVSADAPFPHNIFEAGRVAYRDEAENYGTKTRQYLGFLASGGGAGFNTVAAQVRTLFYYIGREYTVREAADARFIEGRCAEILYNNEPVGVFGEIHPQVLENWGVASPCSGGELDIEALI